MDEREKIIKKLESLRDICNAKSDMAVGDGKLTWAGYANAAADALALLKEQEPVKPTSGEWLYDRPHHFKCSVCGRVEGLVITMYRYCPYCGSMMFLSEAERRKEWSDA